MNWEYLTIHSGLKSLFSIFSMKSVDKNYRWISEEAAKFGQPKVVKSLIDHRANKDLIDSKNKTPLERVEELLKTEDNEEKRLRFIEILAIYHVV